MARTKNNVTIGPLHDIRILDMATVLAAPFGATLCADQGADVVKLELPNGSDALRGLQPVKDGVPLWWKVANRGKKGITLDVRHERGREIFLKMLPSFDVLIENFRTGTMDKWGLDLETLHKANPRLVVLRLTGFGQTGPHANRPGYARIFEARSGLTNLTGEVDDRPLHSNFPIGDAVSGVFAAFSISAEMVRIKGNPAEKGVEIDLAATEALFRLLDFLPVEHEQLGLVRGHVGNRTSYTAPSNMYCDRDGIWFTLVASSDSIFARLCRLIGRDDWITDPRFSTNPARVENMVELDENLSTWFASQEIIDIEALLTAAGVPFTKVFTIKDIEQDDQFKARNAIIRLPDEDYGTLPAPCIVPRVKGRDMPVPRTGPSLGEHNAEIFREFGLTAEDLSALRADGVI